MDTNIKTTSNKDEIDVSSPAELRYWADKFEVTNVKLKAAVNATGSSVKAVEAYLRKR
ncbi:uncharacterized protein DUF3606 [Mucilaginibacter frigoritolerans]|jgi:hypothetical protein|uniref:Uncharacterized protein DUF3606 n=1 Tax=Mucilaginibacter frigoritolerans TaxID=652788 RepID=A0A562TVK0_9SPHI|nr:DUF3606 domain-containing protein [Mucilaginibacter frigoritolerans]TWI97577.1 uncharacterized protein DUF3606 [Mucilaginibacter frigoritolerans]